MTAEMLEYTLPKLRRSLGVGEEADELLIDRLEQAEEEILRYLNRTQLPDNTLGLLVELAGLRHLQQGWGGKKSAAYAEGQISQKDEFYDPVIFAEGAQALLHSLAPYRLVKCREVEA